MPVRPHLRAFHLLALAVALVTSPRLAAAQDYVVVVNIENSASALPRGEVSRLFLKKIATWPSGELVAPVDLPERSSVRGAFSKQVHGKSTNAVKTWWQQQVFSGRAVPPAERTGEQDILAFVRDNPNAIGYVAAGTPLGKGVKAVAILSD